MNEEVNMEEKLRELDEMTKQTLDNSNKALYFEWMKKGHFLSEEFLKRENPTMEEYNVIMSCFDKALEYIQDENHVYFEKIYFIINTNIETPLITVESIDKILIMYDAFMNKTIELADGEEKEQLKQIYESDRNNIRSAIEERRNNYPTVHEEITQSQCVKCFRTISSNSKFCEYCGSKIDN